LGAIGTPQNSDSGSPAAVTTGTDGAGSRGAPAPIAVASPPIAAIVAAIGRTGGSSKPFELRAHTSGQPRNRPGQTVPQFAQEQDDSPASMAALHPWQIWMPNA
jgi:hypothetical protein